MGITRNRCLKLTGLTKHAYYYKHKGRANAGIKPSLVTKWFNDTTGNFELVCNTIVMNEVGKTKQNSDTDYGYEAMTAHLKMAGYFINHKKVYRLMNEYQMLHPPRVRKPKKYVTYRRVYPNQPLEVIEMDIKFQYIMNEERYAYIFTIIDCFSRKTLYWKAALSIKKEDVKEAWEHVVVNFLQPNNMLEQKIKIEVRNDNDKRFEADIVKAFFVENHINQVFTHPYTPQENGHIESFHAILGRSLEKQHYRTIEELNLKLNNFYKTYNMNRLHGSLDHLSPDVFWELWHQDLVEKIDKKGDATLFKLKIPHTNITGNGSLRSFSVPVCA